MFFPFLVWVQSFLILYPIGVTGEWLSLTKNYEAVDRYLTSQANIYGGNAKIVEYISQFLHIYPFILWPGIEIYYNNIIFKHYLITTY